MEKTIRGGVWSSWSERTALSASATSSRAAKRSRARVRVTGATSLRTTSRSGPFFSGCGREGHLLELAVREGHEPRLLVHHRAAVGPDDPVDRVRVRLLLQGDGRVEGQPAAVPGVDLGLVDGDDAGGGLDLARPAPVEGGGELRQRSRLLRGLGRGRGCLGRGGGLRCGVWAGGGCPGRPARPLRGGHGGERSRNGGVRRENRAMNQRIPAGRARQTARARGRGSGSAGRRPRAMLCRHGASTEGQ